MLTIETYVGPSEIEGLGLFARQSIAAGTLVWQFREALDRVLFPNILHTLSPVEVQEVLRSSYVNARGEYVYCVDGAKYMNHSDHPNTVSPDDPEGGEGATYASRDIAPGEELTCDYRTFHWAFRDGVPSDWVKRAM